MHMKERIAFLDYLRVVACFMVMAIHSAEPFYLGGEAPDVTAIASRWNLFWITVTECICRVAVPLSQAASAPMSHNPKKSSWSRRIRLSAFVFNRISNLSFSPCG